MARFYTVAEVLTPEHIQWEVHARGLGCGREPGLVLREVVDRNGGRYEITMLMGERIREQARIALRLGRGEDVAPSEYTFRTATQIVTAAAGLDWLNKGIFVGVGGRQSAGVIYETYLVE